MKKWILYLVAGLAGLGLTACGSPDAEEAASQAEEEVADYSGMNRLEQILAKKKIVLGTSPDYAPYEFEDTTKTGQEAYVGADIALADYIAWELGVELEISAMDFDACLEAVQDGTVDFCLLGMLPTTRRGALVDFTDPYYEEGTQCIVVSQDQVEELDDLEAFEGKTLAAQGGTLQAQLVIEQLLDSDIEVVSNTRQGVQLLKSGQADGLVVSSVVAKRLVAENNNLAVCDAALEYTPTEGLVGGVLKEEPELSERLNEIIAKVVDNGYYFEWLEEAYEQAIASQSRP